MSFTVVAIVGASVAAAGGLAKLGMSLAGRGDRIREQKAAKKRHSKMMREYEKLDTSNIYADVKNPYADIETEFENVYEDMTVNQQQAQFEKQMAQQQQANIMQQMSGAAGGSGIAGLAQAMANQGQLQAQRAGASIGMQESQQQAMKAQGAQQARAMEQQALRTRMAGEAQAQSQRLAGEEQARGLEYQKTGTLLGMSQQRLAAANEARREAKAQQMAAVGDIGAAGMQVAQMGMDAGGFGGGGGDMKAYQSYQGSGGQMSMEDFLAGRKAGNTHLLEYE